MGSGETPCPCLQSAGGPSAGMKTASHEQQRVELPHCLTWNNSPCVPPSDIKRALGSDAPGFAFTLCHLMSSETPGTRPCFVLPLCPVAIIIISLYISLNPLHKFFEERVLIDMRLPSDVYSAVHGRPFKSIYDVSCNYDCAKEMLN